jgi:glycosyltransferase involved in cell wall biosynthesis
LTTWVQPRGLGNAPGTTDPSKPLVSVITVCRNAAATIETCLASVASQTWPALDHVVIDGASTDATQAILDRHRGAIATLVSEPDGGIYDAMNKGLALAKGDFVIFLNADDRFAGPAALADAMAEIAGAPEFDIYYGGLEIRHGEHTLRHTPSPPEQALEEMVVGCLPHQSTLARRAVFGRTGPFDLRWRRHADYDWWLRVLGDPAIRLRRIDTVVASYALGGASSDLAKGQPEVFEIQNSAAVYRTPEWDRRRIAIYQQALLAQRIAEAEARGDRPPWGQPRLMGRVLSWLLRSLPPPAVQALRKAKRRLVG